MISLTAAAPAEVKVLLEREDGSGVIEVPLLSIGPLDFGSGTTLDVTADTLSELVVNFAAYPGPVPVSQSPHVDFDARGGPQPAFVESLEVRDGQLWGRIDLGAELFASVVNRREWRGFSVEMVKNLKLPARKFTGWVLVGGVFTNRPASDVVFKVAAESEPDSGAIVFQPLRGLERPEKESPMSDEKVIGLAAHEAKVGELNALVLNGSQKVTALETRITALEADLRNATERATKMEAELSATSNEKVVAMSRANTLEAQAKALQSEKRALEARVNEAESKLKEVASTQLTAKVKGVISEALDAGVPPALFDGYESDPAAWLEANYATFEAFESNVNRIRGVANLAIDKKPVKSGAESRKEVVTPADGPSLTAEEKAILEAAGVKFDVDFIGVTNEAEARERLKAAKKE